MTSCSARPEYCLDLAWALILTGQIDDAESYLASANQQAGDDRTFLGKVLVAQVHIARTRGQHKQAIELAQAALAILPADHALDRSIVALTLGMAQAARGDLAAAEQALTDAHQAAQASRNHYAGLTALSLLGAMKLAQGQLHRAADLCRQALERWIPTAHGHRPRCSRHPAL